MIDVFQGRSGRIPRFLMGCILLFAGCPASPSTPAPGTPEPQQRTGAPPAHPDFLDGPTLSEKQFTPEQMVEHERKKSQMIFLMDLTTAPPMEAAGLLETAVQAEAMNPGEYKEATLRHHQVRVFRQLASEEILDEELARVILRLGETLRQTSLGAKPGDILFRTVVEAMVRSHDYLGEPEKADALVDAAFEAVREARRAEIASSATPAPATDSPPRATSPRVITIGGSSSATRDWEWLRYLEKKATRLGRKDFPSADALLNEECRTSRDAMQAEPEAVKLVYDWLAFTDLRARYARSAGHRSLADEIVRERKETVRSLADAHPDSVQYFAMVLANREEEVGRVLRNDPKKARELLSGIRASVESSKFAENPALAHFKKSWEAFDGMIATSQFRHDLIGRPALPFEIERWVHGEPLPLESLKGRVTLLAFNQVNHAPCIELYPWLNSLHKEWHERGLEIIQVVRPIHMTWNPKAKRAEVFRQRISLRLKAPKASDVTATPDPGTDPLAADQPVVAAVPPPATNIKAPTDPAAVIEAEVQMLEQLATHYGHPYPTILVPANSTMQGAYGGKVSPYLVVIDRDGKIRAIEDRSTDESRQSIREQLDRLLAE